jgi:hypothetical protein
VDQENAYGSSEHGREIHHPVPEPCQVGGSLRKGAFDATTFKAIMFTFFGIELEHVL